MDDWDYSIVYEGLWHSLKDTVIGVIDLEFDKKEKEDYHRYRVESKIAFWKVDLLLIDDNLSECHVIFHQICKK